jgi:NodT family efflux transporter outer membrane factor (OMF) lipoprotein
MLIAAAVSLSAPAFSSDAGYDKEAWDAILRRHEEKETARTSASSAPSTDEEAISDGSWDELVQRYGNIYASRGEEDVSPETLASWWYTLGDGTLNRLVLWALEDNRELEASRGRVLEARAALGISRASELPWLDNSDSWTDNKSSDNSTGEGSRAEVTKLGIDASWEIDLFGGRRDRTDAAAAALEAEHAALHSAWVSLASEVALNYLSLRTLQERLHIAELNLALQEDTLSMLASQYDAGLRDSLALNQAKYTTEGTRASIPPIRANIEGVMNSLAILTGRVPGSLEEMLSARTPLPRPKQEELVGIPADAIRQRPDVRAAERRLAAQMSTRKSAEKDLLPKFYLAGSIGLETLAGGGLFSGDSFGFSFGPRITLPIFHGGAIRKNIQAQTAREEQLLAAYEQTVLSAVAEVRNAMAADTQERERNRSLNAGIEAAKMALDVAVDKYKNGITDFNNVISAQVALLSLEDQMTISDGQMVSNLVRIYKALGGGWAPLTEEFYPSDDAGANARQ